MNIQYCSCIASCICSFITSHLRLSCLLSNSDIDVCLLTIKVLFYVLVSFKFGEISNVLSIVLKSLADLRNYIRIYALQNWAVGRACKISIWLVNKSLMVCWIMSLICTSTASTAYKKNSFEKWESVKGLWTFYDQYFILL